ncbi:hypothetical protein VDG1235_1797 [Verrucomicrobiia bacterium DG1235]|nr:hypothetical protein VDG1235_1797 [Verrucomicrobiae bacterium DG1235]
MGLIIRSMRHPALYLIATAFLFSSCGKNETATQPTSTENDPKIVAETTAPAKLDDSILEQGIVATLQLAAKRAVDELSKPESFANNEALRIKLPESFAPVESALEKIGQEKILNDFTDSLNEAARSAVAASPQILSETIKKMQVQDVMTIWRGGDDAATRYLETNTRKQISELMLPIIKKQTEDTGATRYFKQITELLPKKKGGLLDNLAALAGVQIPSDFDLDQFVSDKALDGLYTTLASEEAKIRANPAERSTELIKSAFDYFKKK